jgi:hypothetical protein
MIYTNVLNRGGCGVRSPADMLWAGVAGSPGVRQLSLQPNFYASALPPDHQLMAGEDFADDSEGADVDK